MQRISHHIPKHVYLIVVVVIIFSVPGCQKQTALSVDVASAAEIKERINAHQGQQAVLVNFWATWCQPCVEEFPMITDLATQYEPEGLKVYYVSVDFIDNLEGVKTFLTKMGVHEASFIKPDGNDNEFIDDIHNDWTGAIPFTIVFSKTSGKVESFWEGVAEREQFEQAVIAALNS
jgi:thiol-disulfide isomerase/thioredoxin